MAGIVYTKLLDALKGIGVDVSQQQASNVSRLTPKNKSTATKVGLLAAERDRGGNFATVLDIFKDEAKYIDSMNDAEQMAFLNNIIDYNEFGGPKIKTTSELNQQAKDLGLEFKGLKSESKDLKTSIEDLQGLAKKMKDEAEANKNRALQDLEDFISTGGQPLKKKNDKFLGGSMHEEGQLRTGIREFLKTEYKNGRLKLNDLDKERIMQYSPMTEHDPILVFKRIYGDEAYKKAGSFPGAFEKGESFTHYEQIFRENMGEDLLTVKNKEYVGDGKLILTESEEVIKPTPDDDDIPFAKGGRASFAGGKLVSEIIAAIVKKEPIEAMKEVNKVIGKKGKYKNLKDEDINKIVEGTNDWIMQRDPDNLYVYDDGKTVWDDDLTKEQLIEKEGRKYDQENIEGTPPPGSRGGSEDIAAPVQSADESLKDMIENELVELEGIGATKMAERARLKLKYPGITDDLLNKILIDDNPQRKAEVLATIDEAFKMMEKGKGPEEIVEIFKNTKRTKNSTGGRASFATGLHAEKPKIDIRKLRSRMLKHNDQPLYIDRSILRDLIQALDGAPTPNNYDVKKDLPKEMEAATGGRAGFYSGGQSMIEPDLSDIGHGSDSLMSRNRVLSPGSQTTTSTGLNYLLGEDNDNTRVPFKQGLIATDNPVEQGKTKIIEKIKSDQPEKKDEQTELFEMVKEFQKFKRFNPDSRFTFSMFAEQKKKEKELYKNKVLELALKYPDKKIINEEGFVNKENLKEAIDEAEADLEISPIDGLILKRSINTEGEQSATSGSFDINNFSFSSPNIEEGKLTSSANFDFGGLNLSGMVNTNDSKILNKEIGFNYDNALKGKLAESDGYRSTELDLNKTFPINDKFNLNLTGSADTQTFNGKTYKSSDLTPKLSYNDGIVNASIAKEVMEGNNTPNLSAGINFNDFYLQGGNLLSEKDKTGVIGYQKEFGDPDGSAFFTIGGEKDLFDDNYTAGVGLNYKFAEGGIAGLRPGYAGGTLVDKGRRGFLKLLGATAGGVAALKLGLGKMLGKESGAVSKKVIDEVIIDGGTGAPAWLQPLVNKALREGIDKTKTAAYKDAQVVKSLDTPTGKVDVYYDVRTGEVEIDYIGGNTALGESVNMRYTPGIADEGTGGKPADEFEATESIPEGRRTGPDDFDIEMGENTTDQVKNLYSDLSELQTLGGKKELINDISVTLQKKKILKQMEDDPAQFVTDVQGDYVPD